MDRQDIAQHDNASTPGHLGQDGPDDVDGRHHVERIAVVLIDHNAVEAHLTGILVFLEVRGIEVAGLLRIEIPASL